MKIVDAEVIVTSPDRNFVTLRITTDEGLHGLGDAHAQRPRAGGRVATSRDHVVPLLIGRDAAPDRGHLAVPVPLGVLAPGAGDDGGDRRGGHGAVGHQGQGRRDAALPAARRRVAGPGSWPTATRPAGTLPELFDSIRAAPGEGLPLDPGADRGAGHQRGLRRRGPAPARGGDSGTTTSRPSAAPLPAEEDWDTRAYLRHLPTVFEAVRNEFGPELPLLHDGHHRMTPIQAARLGKDLEPYDLFWLEDCTPGGEPGGAAAGPPAHHDARWRSARSSTRCGTTRTSSASSSSTTCARRSPTPAASRALQKAARLRRAVPDQVRHARADGHLPGRHGGGAAPGPGDPQLRHPGVHAARRPDRRGVPAVLHLGRTATCTRARSRDSASRLDEDAAGRYPYEPAYLPFNRLQDGTVHDW